MLKHADLLQGRAEHKHDLWPACQWGRYDQTRPMLQWDTAWRALRDGAVLHGLRFPRSAAHGHHRLAQMRRRGIAWARRSAATCLAACWSTTLVAGLMRSARRSTRWMPLGERMPAPNGNGDGDSSKGKEEAPDEGGIDALVEVCRRPHVTVTSQSAVGAVLRLTVNC